jgi:hypothetical protein
MARYGHHQHAATHGDRKPAEGGAEVSASPSNDRAAPPKAVRRLMLDRGGAIVLAVLALYLWLAPGHIVDGDNAEFVTAGALGGRAHPSGYPLFVLWLRATWWLPGGPAHAAAIATALLGAAQVAVLHAACRAWGARPLAATIAVAIYAAGPVALRTYTEAEVFALNGLVIAGVLLVAAEAGPWRGVARGLALGLVAGLGLANHMTCALVAPVGILGVVRAAREKRVAVLAAAGGLVAGLLPYLYLYVAPEATSFGRVDGVGDLVAIVMREDYGGPGAFVPHGVDVPMATNLEALATTIGRAWLWLPAVLGVVGLGWFAVRGSGRATGADAKRAGATRADWIALAVSWLVAGPLLVAKFNVEPRDVGLYVSQRFHLLPVLLLVVPVAVALDRVGARVRLRLSAAAGTAIAVAGFAAAAGLALPRILAVHSPAMAHGMANLLGSAPENAIVLVSSDDQCLGTRYYQLVEGLRPDVGLVCWPLTSRDWYRDRLARAGIPIRLQPGGPISVADAEALLATGRPLLVDATQPVVVAGLPNYPWGILDRVIARGERPPSLRQVIAQNRELFEAFDLDEPHPSQDDDIAAVAYRRYARTWRLLARAAEAAGDREDAALAARLAQELAPTP